MVTVSSLTLDRMSRELLSSWIRVKTSASSDSFSGICRTLRKSCSVDWRWISFWAWLKGSVVFSTSGDGELTSWDEMELFTRSSGQNVTTLGCTPSYGGPGPWVFAALWNRFKGQSPSKHQHCLSLAHQL